MRFLLANIYIVNSANFGLFCSTPGIAIARSVSRKVALKMLLTGLPISAEEAYRSGLVSKVVPTQLLGRYMFIELLNVELQHNLDFFKLSR